MVAAPKQALAGADTGWCRITEISHQYDAWTLSVKLDCTVQNDGCSSPGSYVLTDPNTGKEDYKNKLPLIMGAFTAGKEIKFWLDGCSSNAPRIRIVVVRP
jgi:hypothetical protein